MKDERVVAAIRKEYSVGLQLVERFQKGDHVAHVTMGDGVVTDNSNQYVSVTYEKKFRDGTPMRGCYGVLWFNHNPTMLFHRGTKPTHPTADGTRDA